MKLVILYYYLVTKFMMKANSRRLNQFVLNQRLRSLVSYLKANSSYYRKLNTALFFEWPIINKQILMAQFNEFNTKNIDRDRAFEVASLAESDRTVRSEINGVTIGLSSGTSAVRGLVMASRFERAVWAGIILAKCLPHSILKKQKIALFLRANSEIYGDVNSKTIEFRYYALNESTEENITSLGIYRPDVLVSPPSMLRLVADAQSQGRIKLNPLKIISVAEVLDPIDERYIESVFQMKLHQIYQCTEGFLASTCEFGTLHLNEDYLMVDKHFIDDEKQKFMPILTDTLRTTQPIVKYEQNDILTLKKDPCPCLSKLTALECIEGRTEDIFYLRHQSTEVLVKIFPDTLRRVIFEASDTILEYKLVQESSTLVTLALKGPDVKADFVKAQKSLLDLFAMNHCVPSEVRHIPYVDHELFIKVRRVESRLSNPALIS